MVEMFKQWDAMCEKAAKYPGMDGNSAKGRAVFDILNCKSLNFELELPRVLVLQLHSTAPKGSITLHST